MRTINDILKTDGNLILSVTPDTSINRAIELMANKQVRSLPVLEAGKLIGSVTEKDCINKVIVKGKSPEETQVREIMASDSAIATPAQSVEDCLLMMTEKHIQQLPVISNGALVGFVSMSDMLLTIINDQNDYIHRLENYVMGIGFI